MPVSVPPFISAAQDLADALRKYQPDPNEPGSMYEMFAQVGMLPDALAEIAKGFTALANTCEGLPLHPHVAELVDAMAQVQVTAAHAAEAIPEGIRVLHAEDLARHESPRVGEQAWNVPPGGV